MNETMIYVPLEMFTELVKCQEKLRVIRDYVNDSSYSVSREELAILGDFELKEVEKDATV